MKTKRQLQMVLAAQALLLLTELHAGQPIRGNYQFTTISLPDNTQTLAGPTDEGFLTGYYVDGDGLAHGFLWGKGGLTALGAPGWLNTLCSGINDAGVITGNYDDTVATHCFLYGIVDQSWTQLPDIAGKPLSFAGGISNGGAVVGCAFDDSNVEAGWIWDGASYSFFTVPGADLFFPIAINNMGQVAGYYPEDPANPFGEWHGFLKDGATTIGLDVPVPGTTGTFPIGLNNQGAIAGTYYGVYEGTFEVHGFVLHKGTLLTVDYPEAFATELWGVNDRGQVSGVAWLPSGFVAFIATPGSGGKR